MPSGEITKSLLGGLIAGAWSGFLGVSPGGFLLPIISLLLPFAQHEWISLGIATPDALFVRGPDWNWIRRRTLVGPAGHWRGTGDTALSVGLLHKHQPEAQALTLAVTALPLTLPAAWVCARQGFRLPCVPITFLLVGLLAGGWVGSVFANRLTERNLKMCVRVLLAVRACYMAARAIRS